MSANSEAALKLMQRAIEDGDKEWAGVLTSMAHVYALLDIAQAVRE